MKVITAIYLNCRPDLRDEWLTNNDIDGDVEDSLVSLLVVILGQSDSPPSLTNKLYADWSSSSIRNTILHMRPCYIAGLPVMRRMVKMEHLRNLLPSTLGLKKASLQLDQSKHTVKIQQIETAMVHLLSQMAI